MYIPAHFRAADRAELLAFMRRYAFATLVSAGEDGRPEATHLPFLIEERDGEVFLLAHLARANPHARLLEGRPALVIFAEPHAYISPALYDKELNVPTWNYLAVHAYGPARLLDGETEGRALLEKQIMAYEPAYRQQWDRLPEGYRRGMLQGIVPFEIRVEELQGKKKLSQNKTGDERERIRAALEGSGEEVARAVGEYMGKGA
jgi:transcriptional regulator